MSEREREGVSGGERGGRKRRGGRVSLLLVLSSFMQVWRLQQQNKGANAVVFSASGDSGDWKGNDQSLQLRGSHVMTSSAAASRNPTNPNSPLCLPDPSVLMPEGVDTPPAYASFPTDPSSLRVFRPPPPPPLCVRACVVQSALAESWQIGRPVLEWCPLRDVWLFLATLQIVCVSTCRVNCSGLIALLLRQPPLSHISRMCMHDLVSTFLSVHQAVPYKVLPGHMRSIFESLCISVSMLGSS